MWSQYLLFFHWNKLLSPLVENGHFYNNIFWAFPFDYSQLTMITENAFHHHVVLLFKGSLLFPSQKTLQMSAATRSDAIRMLSPFITSEHHFDSTCYLKTKTLFQNWQLLCNYDIENINLNESNREMFSALRVFKHVLFFIARNELKKNDDFQWN
jgi:hypothetical protein